jgi:hypothetical protein
MNQPEDYIEMNRANWDARVPIHLQGYDLECFRSDPGFISKVVRFDLPRLPELKGLRERSPLPPRCLLLQAGKVLLFQLNLGQDHVRMVALVCRPVNAWIQPPSCLDPMAKLSHSSKSKSGSLSKSKQYKTC